MWTSSRSPLPAIGQHSHRTSSPSSNALVPHKQSETDTFKDNDSAHDIVTVEAARGTDTSPNRRGVPVASSPIGGFSSSRLLHLESRMNANEQAYRGVLEELVRLQGEMRTGVRRNDDQWKEERRERFQLREGLQVTAERLNELASRIEKAEQRAVRDERGVHSLAQHLQKIDLLVVERQRAVETKHEQQKVWNDRFGQNVESVSDQMRQFHEQLDRKITSLGAEIKQWKVLEATRKAEMDEWMIRMTKSMEHAELEQKDVMESITHLQGKQSRVESSVSRMRDKLESRWNDLGEVLREMRRSLQQVDSDRRSQDELLKQRLAADEESALQHAKQCDGAVGALSKVLAEREQQHATEQQHRNEQMTSLAEELNKRILDVEMKMKDDTNSRLTAVEMALKDELGLQSGISKEHQIRNEQQLETINRKVDDQVAAVRNGLKMDRVQVSQSLNQLHEAISLIESQADIHSDNLKRVIQAEIRTRHRELEQLQQQCSELQDRLNSALAQLQQSMATVSGQMMDAGQQFQMELKKRVAESQEVISRRLGDVEIRVTSLADQLSQSSESRAVQIQELQQKLKDSQQSGLSSLTHSHTMMQNRVKELQSQLSSFSNHVTENVERLQLFKVDVNSRLEAEKQLRMREGQAVRRELGMKVNHDAFQQMNGDAGLRVGEIEGKVAQAVSQLSEFETGLHSLKVDLNGRISSEANMRVELALESKERLTKIESQLAQQDFLIHHSADMMANRELVVSGEATEDPIPHHVLEESSENGNNETGGIENDRTPLGETEEEYREDSLPSDIQSHESEPPQQINRDDIPQQEGQLVAGDEEYRDLPNATEQVESLQSEQESSVQRQHSQHSEQTEAEEM